MERRQKWQTPARIYHNNGVSELMEKERWCIQVALSSVESCSSNEFSQFFVAHSCAGSAKWARSIAETRKYAYSLQTTPSRVPISSRTPPTFLSKLEPPLVPVRRTQWPIPQFFSVGYKILPPHMSPAEATMLPVAPE
jgi:hypothetical protein